MELNDYLRQLANELESVSGQGIFILDIYGRKLGCSQQLVQDIESVDQQSAYEMMNMLLRRLEKGKRHEVREKLYTTIKSGRDTSVSMNIDEGPVQGNFTIFFYSNRSIQPGKDLCIGKVIKKEQSQSGDPAGYFHKQIYRMLFLLPDPMIIISPQGRIHELNPAAAEFLGVSPSDGRQQYVQNFIQGNKQAEFDKVVSSTIQKGASQNKNIVFNPPKGSIRYVELSSAVMLENETLQYIGLFIRDVSENVVYQKQLEKEKRRAQEADRLKTAFLSNMSHEIRTPMNAVIGFAELLNDIDTSKEEQREYSDLIIRNSTQLLGLIDDIIDVAKIEAGQVQIKKELFPLSEIVSRTSNIAREFIESEGKDIGIKILTPEDTSADQVFTDPYRVIQVMKHLLSNAVKFTTKGTISAGYSVSTFNNKPAIRFFVRDTGIGIPEEKQALIFERFRQVEETHIRDYKGAGLGLTICKKLIELLDGEIGFSSQTGEGSVFFFYLPMDALPEKTIKQKKPEKVAAYNWPGKRILIAEDIEANYLYLEALLKPTGVHIVWTGDGDTTVEKCLEDGRIDLVLMDVQMPGMNGYEATAVIKKYRKALPVIALTAFASYNEQEKSIRAGCDFYLTKPLKAEILLPVIEKFIM
ncbi:MAG: ATP-binding protein [Bacteroidales bacterium]